MISETPIVALGPEDSDVEQIIKATNTGTYFKYSDKLALKTHFKKAFEAYNKGLLKSNPIGLQQYSRRALTQRLVTLLNDF